MKRVGQIYRETLVGQIKSGFDSNANIFLLSYSKISALKISDFRKNLKQVGAKVCVSKNSIARVALKELAHESLVDSISDQTAFVWSNEDAADVAKILVKFEKDCDTATVKGGILDGRILKNDDVQRLSDLPSREVLLAMLFSTIQAPLVRFASALNAKTSDLLSILKQLSEKREVIKDD